jgi:hypothetical protein
LNRVTKRDGRHTECPQTGGLAAVVVVGAGAEHEIEARGQQEQGHDGEGDPAGVGDDGEVHRDGDQCDQCETCRVPRVEVGEPLVVAHEQA